MTVPGTQHPLGLLNIWPGDRIRVIGNAVPDDEEDYRGSLGTVSGVDPAEVLPVFVIVDQAEEGFGTVQFTIEELEVVTPGPISTYIAALRAQTEAWGVVEAIATAEPPIGAQEARIFAQKALAQAGGEP